MSDDLKTELAVVRGEIDAMAVQQRTGGDGVDLFDVHARKDV